MSEGKRVDEDWKRRAQAEKELDSAKAAPPPPAAPAAPGAPGALPKSEAKTHPMFGGLVESLASQALLYMGAMRDPMTGQVHQDLQQSQTMIEMLGMLEEKTKGNLSKEEAEMLKQVLDEVRMHFVRITTPPPPNPKGPMMGNKK
ncbi:MAG: DUF1844 domain-containing protein [Planctomycetes bacterium]|nr:DUF1844 domain-containing protein [Planctomycetota bacterium]